MNFESTQKIPASGDLVLEIAEEIFSSTRAWLHAGSDTGRVRRQ